MKKLLSSLFFICILSSTVLAASCVDDCNNEQPCCTKNVGCPALPITRAGTITQPGRYCLKQDITGQLSILSDDVEIDLNSHQVTGPSGQAAIVADGHTNVYIHSGSVTSQGGNGIELANCNDVSLSDIALFETSQALVLDTCLGAKVRCLSIFDNINNSSESQTAVVGVLNSDCVDFTQVFVCNNTKALPSIFTGVQPNIGIFTIYKSRNVSLNGCKINGSIRANDNSQMAALLIFESSNCSVITTEVNDTISTASTGGALVDVLYGILLQGSNNPQSSDFVLESCHVTNTTGEDRIDEINGIKVDTCNNTTIRATEVNTISSEIAALSLKGIAINACSNTLIESSQTHDIKAMTSTSCFGIDVQVSDNTVIKGHTASNIASVSTSTFGIRCSGTSTSATIDSCYISQIGKGGAFAKGISMSNINGITISACSISNFPDSRQDIAGIELFNCSNGALTSNEVFNLTTTGFNAYGIRLQASQDIAVQECTVSDITGDRFISGIYALQGTRLTFDTCVTTDMTRGTGIMFFETTNSTVRDCISTQNAVGFEDDPDDQNTFFGNYAEANTDFNYSGVNGGGNILFFNKSTGIFTDSGNTVKQPNRWTNIEATPGLSTLN